MINGKEHDEWDFYTTAMQKVSDEMAKTYVGRSLAEVQKEFETAGAVLRVVSEDADHKAITADYRPERLNVEVEKGVITNAYFG